jgi:hypothetical protein
MSQPELHNENRDFYSDEVTKPQEPITPPPMSQSDFDNQGEPREPNFNRIDEADSHVFAEAATYYDDDDPFGHYAPQQEEPQYPDSAPEAAPYYNVKDNTGHSNYQYPDPEDYSGSSTSNTPYNNVPGVSGHSGPAFPAFPAHLDISEQLAEAQPAGLAAGGHYTPPSISNPSLGNEEISIDSGYATDDGCHHPPPHPHQTTKTKETKPLSLSPNPSISAQSAYKPKCKPAVSKENGKENKQKSKTASPRPTNFDPRILAHKRIYQPKWRANEKRRPAVREKRAQRFGQRAWMKWRAYWGSWLCREYV